MYIRNDHVEKKKKKRPINKRNKQAYMFLNYCITNTPTCNLFLGKMDWRMMDSPQNKKSSMN